MTTWDHTTPLIWTVGSASAVTVVGVAGAAGFSGAESARAASARPIEPAASKKLSRPATAVFGSADTRPDMSVSPRWYPVGVEPSPADRRTLSVTTGVPASLIT